MRDVLSDKRTGEQNHYSVEKQLSLNFPPHSTQACTTWEILPPSAVRLMVGVVGEGKRASRRQTAAVRVTYGDTGRHAAALRPQRPC